jgi:CheY-like chemotaxis protein
VQVSHTVAHPFQALGECRVSYDFVNILGFQIGLIPSGDSERRSKKQSRGRPDQQENDSAARNRVLLLGRVKELALYRAEVLRDRGFEVRSSTDHDEALHLIRSSDYDAIVLSYTLSSDAVQELAEEARQHCPDCPVVVIAKTRILDRRIAPDEVALADDGPAALVMALRRVLRLQ